MGFGVHTLTFDGRDDVGAGAVALRFVPGRPLGHTAGQHGFWTIPGAGVRPFTIASAPEEPHVLLATNMHDRSRLKRALGALRPGDRMRLVGPVANFTLRGAGPEVVMLAQGIGVTPFRAMLAGSDGAADTTFVHVGAAAGPFAGHAFRDETEAAAGDARYVTGRDAFAAEVRSVLAARPGATYLVSGSRAFVNATAADLRAGGVPRDRIRRDGFIGWSGPSTTPAKEPS